MCIHLKGECCESFSERPKWTWMNAWIDKRTCFGSTGLTKIGKNKSWALVSHDHKNLMLECPHGCMYDQFCIKFSNHQCCMCIMEIMWDISFFPKPLAKPTSWHISCSAVLQALSQNPNLPQTLPSEEKKNRREFPIKDKGTIAKWTLEVSQFWL